MAATTALKLPDDLKVRIAPLHELVILFGAAGFG